METIFFGLKNFVIPNFFGPKMFWIQIIFKQDLSCINIFLNLIFVHRFYGESLTYKSTFFCHAQSSSSFSFAGQTMSAIISINPATQLSPSMFSFFSLILSVSNFLDCLLVQILAGPLKIIVFCDFQRTPHSYLVGKG